MPLQHATQEQTDQWFQTLLDRTVRASTSVVHSVAKAADVGGYSVAWFEPAPSAQRYLKEWLQYRYSRSHLYGVATFTRQQLLSHIPMHKAHSDLETVEWLVEPTHKVRLFMIAGAGVYLFQCVAGEGWSRFKSPIDKPSLDMRALLSQPEEDRKHETSLDHIFNTHQS